MSKLKKIVTLMLAFVMVITCVSVTSVQAASKINKKTASIYETETVQLKVKGVKSVTWRSSNKKIASVSKTGLVTGVKKGTCTITAKDSKTKASFSCKVTVKKAAAFDFTAKDISVLGGGDVILYPGEPIKGATYVLDGKKLSKNAYSIFTDVDEESGRETSVNLTKKLTDGKHTFSIQKKGYKTVTKTFKFETYKVEGMFSGDSWVSDGILYIFCNPKLDGKDFVVKVDGNKVEPKNSFLSGDGEFVIWVNATSFTPGEHSLSVTADGLPDGNATFTVE